MSVLFFYESLQRETFYLCFLCAVDVGITFIQLNSSVNDATAACLTRDRCRSLSSAE